MSLKFLYLLIILLAASITVNKPTLADFSGPPSVTGISGLGTGVATALGNAANASGGVATVSASALANLAAVATNVGAASTNSILAAGAATVFPSTFSVPRQILNVGAGGQFDETRVEEATPVVIGGTVNLFYAAWNSTGVGAIGLATGTDLGSLTKQGPVLQGTAAQWDAGYVSGPGILVENGTCYLYYFGSANSGFEATPSNIGVATAPVTGGTTCGTFTKFAGNPILSTGAGGQWDSATLYRPFPLHVGSTYYIFYNALNAGIEQIGYATATSPTGPFTKYGSNPILTVTSNAWDGQRIGDPWVNYDSGSGAYTMFYYGAPTTGTPQFGVASATAPSGPWTKGAGPFMPFGWSNADHIRPALVQVAGQWWVLFDPGRAQPNSGIYQSALQSIQPRAWQPAAPATYPTFQTNPAGRFSINETAPPASETGTVIDFASDSSSHNITLVFARFGVRSSFLGNDGTNAILGVESTGSVVIKDAMNYSASNILGSGTTLATFSSTGPVFNVIPTTPTGKQPLCIDTSTKIVYQGSAGAC